MNQASRQLQIPDETSAEPGSDDTGERLPDVVYRAAERNTLLRAALQRWHIVCPRLLLSRAAAAAGALLLSVEFDEGSRRTLCKGGEGSPGAARTTLLEHLEQRFQPVGLAAALLELEQRRVVIAHPPDSPWIGQALRLTAELRDYCAGATLVEESRASDKATQEYVSTPRLEAQINEVARLEQEFGGNKLLVVIRGAAGSGRDGVLARVLMVCQKSAIVRTTAELAAAMLSLEPELSGAAAIWDARRTEPTPFDEQVAARWLDRSPSVAVALLDRRQDPPELSSRRLLRIDADLDGFDERYCLWHGLLERILPSGQVSAIASALAQRSRCGRGLAARASSAAEPLPEEPAAAVTRVETCLDVLVRPSTQRGVVVERPEVPMSRLIVSEQVGGSLEQFLVLAELECGFDCSDRRGVKALFSGPSGTGKTLAARALAAYMRLPLYRLDLAAVVSKWVGETEKNLSSVLESAEAAGALLLFDEGDALLAKRGEVTRGSDRYANLEASYLLQALEAHDGIVIVTTNQKQNIDNAFQRRFDLYIEFGPPSHDARVLLWRQELGGSAAALPEPFMNMLGGPELSGGNIASSARLARALANRRGEPHVSVDDVCSAVTSELMKLGSSVKAANWTSQVRRHG